MGKIPLLYPCQKDLDITLYHNLIIDGHFCWGLIHIKLTKWYISFFVISNLYEQKTPHYFSLSLCVVTKISRVNWTQLRGKRSLNLLWSVILTKSNYIRPRLNKSLNFQISSLASYFKRTSAFVVYALCPQDAVHDKRFFLIKVFGKLKMA